MTAIQLVRLLHGNGWVDVRQTGSHRHLKHSDKPGVLLTVPMHPGTLGRGLVAKILKDAGVEES